MGPPESLRSVTIVLYNKKYHVVLVPGHPAALPLPCVNSGKESRKELYKDLGTGGEAQCFLPSQKEHKLYYGHCNLKQTLVQCRSLTIPMFALKYFILTEEGRADKVYTLTHWSAAGV